MQIFTIMSSLVQLSLKLPSSPPLALPPGHANFKRFRPRSFHWKCQARASQAHDEYSTNKVVEIRHSDLLERNADVSEELEAGFGPSGLGIIAISGVPKFPALRKNLLWLSHRLAALPEEVKKDLEDPDSRYSFGWSHGKEKLESGQPDKLKGSFYANPIVDVPTIDESLMQRYPSYCHPNFWPKNDLPELEFAFKDLGKLILDVGLLLAYHCDKYVSKRNPNHEVQSLEQMLRRSLCHKGRLLHYFPPALSEHDQSIEGSSSWCGWHTDHSSLTGVNLEDLDLDSPLASFNEVPSHFLGESSIGGLTCAMYLKGGSSITCPDNTAGLYVKTQTGAIVKVVFGENQIAYQLGEATEILSRGLFHATPHCVKAAKGDQASGVERDTFALFMQPHWDEPLNVSDPSAYPYEELVKSNGNITFGDFSEQLLSKYYGL